MMIGQYAASIIAHYYASNMAAIFSDCTLGESLKHLQLGNMPYNILGVTVGIDALLIPFIMDLFESLVNKSSFLLPSRSATLKQCIHLCVRVRSSAPAL